MNGILITLLSVAALASCAVTHLPNGCPLDFNIQTIFAHEYCDHFYVCFYGSPIPAKCTGDLLYNDQLQVCDWPTNVQCGDRIVPGVGINVPQLPAAGICTGVSSGTFVAHEDCDKFYVCVSNQPLVIKCPEGLHYNQKLQVCVVAQNAECIQ